MEATRGVNQQIEEGYLKGFVPHFYWLSSNSSHRTHWIFLFEAAFSPWNRGALDTVWTLQCHREFVLFNPYSHNIFLLHWFRRQLLKNIEKHFPCLLKLPLSENKIWYLFSHLASCTMPSTSATISENYINPLEIDINVKHWWPHKFFCIHMKNITKIMKSCLGDNCKNSLLLMPFASCFNQQDYMDIQLYRILTRPCLTSSVL